MPLIGVALGIFLSMALWNREVAAELARSPDELVCGNPGMIYLFHGFVGGTVGGILAGLAIAKFVTWLVRGGSSDDAFEEIDHGDDVATDEMIAETKNRANLRADIDFVEQMVTQAKNDGDEDVLRKLIAFKATLRAQLGT